MPSTPFEINTQLFISYVLADNTDPDKVKRCVRKAMDEMSITYALDNCGSEEFEKFVDTVIEYHDYEHDISRASTEWFVTHTKETFAERKKMLQDETNLVVVEYIDDVCSPGEVVPGAGSRATR
jgi:spore cortex formation protein SpoVR/YcgB (stage V sporulation)